MAETSVTVPCYCCRKTEPNRQCYEILAWSRETEGAPACETTVDISFPKKYITTMIGSAPSSSEVQRAAVGSISVDCSMEPSGFCRDRGGSRSYPFTRATYEGALSSSNGLTYMYLFEDCPFLTTGNNADVRISIYLRYAGDGYFPAGSDCNSSPPDSDSGEVEEV